MKSIRQRVPPNLSSRSWRLLQRLQKIRLYLIPRASRREQLMYTVLRGISLLRRAGLKAFVRRLGEKLSHYSKGFLLRLARQPALRKNAIPFTPIQPPPPLQRHTASVDVVICVHNALADVQRCLESVVRYTPPPYSLILVDDGSDQPTQAYLTDFALSQGALLLRNEQARGYTRAANQGLQASSADYVVLLNSDTIVSPRWLDRMVACGESHPGIGLIGPLSNTASWQSIPEVFSPTGDWADNPLPEGMSVAEMGQRLAVYAGRVYPRLTFLNGFCLMIKRQLISQIGYFDEQRFGDGYAEENDYCLRTAKAGWKAAVADDAYIYHAQSRSYSHERRKQLVARSDKIFGEKHGFQAISEGIRQTRFDRSLLGCRARSQVMALRQQLIDEGKARWEGKRVAFYLPISAPSGGGHVVMQESLAMQKMGVLVELINLQGHQTFFRGAYPHLGIPTVYIDDPLSSASMLHKYDAVLGTMYHTPSWMRFPDASRLPVRGYYIQDFEPDFFPPGSTEQKQALESYTLYPDLVRLTKTAWNRQIVLGRTGADCHIVGPSVDIDLYRPRPRRDPDFPARPLRIAAMIRPSTPRRQPELTMQILSEISRQQRDNIEVILFGCKADDPGFRKLKHDIPFSSLISYPGVLNPAELAALLNEVDIFVDFSSFQAMGLTAMEAMACGAAVIVPQTGGATSFARHAENALVIDTRAIEPCVAALDQLIRDEQLRSNLQQQATFDICQYPPEMAAYNMLNALLP